MVLRRIQRHLVVGFLVLFILVSASAFTGSRSTPTACPRRTMPLPVYQSAPSTVHVLSAFGLASHLQYLGDGASHRIQPTKSRSRIFRRNSTALFAKRGRPKIPDEEMAGKKEQLRELLCATKAEIDKLVKQCKGVLISSDIVENHGPKVALLQERLGIDQKAAGKMCLNANRLLSSKLETLVSKIDWLQARLNLSKTQLKTILTRAPNIITLSIEDNLQPKLDNMQSLLELSDKELTKMTVRTPDWFPNFSTEKLAPRMYFLHNLLNIEEGDTERLRKIIVKHPEMLLYPEERMLEIQRWMKDRFGWGHARIAQIFRNVPQLLFAKIETLNERANDIQKELSLTDKELSKAISTVPNLLAQRVEDNIRPKTNYFRSTFELNAMDLKDLLVRYPILLRYSIKDNFDPKVKLYSKLSGEAVAKEAILENPNLLTVSQKSRLQPRLAEVEEQDGAVRWTKTLLIRMATRTPAAWEAYRLNEARPKGRP